MQITVLQAVYDKTGGRTNWIPNNWFRLDATDDICSFDGIECDMSTGIVENIRLSSFGLSGTIPDELYSSQPLWSQLDMSNNKLTGTVSSEILNCCSETIILSNNLLTGPLPLLGQQQQLTLKNVDFSENGFTGVIPLGRLQRKLFDDNIIVWVDYLQDLRLNGNSLSGDIPTEVGSIMNLTFLLLQGNRLDGSLPSELGNLQNLQELNVGDNLVIGALPSELGNMENLQEFNIENNQIAGGIPSELGNLQNLKLLNLGNNLLEGELPAELGNIKSLQEFNVGDNQIGGSIPVELSTLHDLQIFNLGTNNFEGSIPENLFDDMESLASFSLSSIDITGSLPASMSNLSGKSVTLICDVVSLKP